MKLDKKSSISENEFLWCFAVLVTGWFREGADDGLELVLCRLGSPSIDEDPGNPVKFRGDFLLSVAVLHHEFGSELTLSTSAHAGNQMRRGSSAFATHKFSSRSGRGRKLTMHSSMAVENFR